MANSVALGASRELVPPASGFVPYETRTPPRPFLTPPSHRRAYPRRRRTRKERDMLDVVMIGMTVAFFAIAFGFIWWLERV
jgi:hypothetical protein